MKIVVDARIIYTSTGRYVERLLHHLQDLDNENEYLVLLLAKDFDRWRPRGENFQKIVADFPPYTVREQVQLALLLYRIKPDLVHFTMPQQPLLYFGRHVTTVHDLTLIQVINRRKFGLVKDLYKNHLKPAVFKVALREFLRSSAKIIVPTHHVKSEIIRDFGVAARKLAVTYEAAEALTTEAKKPDWVADNEVFVLYVGNAFPYKNVWGLIEGFEKLGRSDIKLILVGKKEFFYTELEERVREKGISGVVFAGFTPDEELVWLYQHAKVFATASLLEGFGLPALEAMVYGVPTLASKASCMPEVYGDGARYFDPKDPSDIAAKIGAVLDDPKLQVQMRMAGAARAKQFSWRRMAEETLSVYREV